MKTFLVLFLLITTFLSPQQNDDIRIFQSTNHQTEISVAIDPTNSNNVLAACIGSPISGGTHTPYFYSSDRGITWVGTDNSPNNVSTRGDPYVVFNKLGVAFFVNKGNPGINFFKSTNKGISWITKPQITNEANADKPHIAVGMSQSNQNHVYIAWTHAEPDNQRVYFTRSTNAGESFSEIQLYNGGVNEGLGCNIAAGPEGNVYVAFVKETKDNFIPQEILFYRSTNAGVSFSQIKSFSIKGMSAATAPNSYFNDTRINCFPFLAVDNSGNIYMVYSNNTATEGGDIHIYMQKSTDQGNNWSSSVSIHSGSGIRQWFPSIAIDHTTGTIYISYYNMISGSPRKMCGVPVLK